MSNLTEHAKRELESIGAFSENGDFYGGMTGDAVMELIEVFAKQEHSGMSASVVRNLFNKLADYKPLSPITCKKNEWIEVSKNIYQNKRESGVFKDGKNGQPYYLDAVVFRTQNGNSFTGTIELENDKKLSSRQFINIPFVPKTFYIDIIETESKRKLKDKSQLDEVFKYYKKGE